MKKSITPLEYKYSFGGMITGGILLSIMSIFMTIVSIFSKSDLDGDSPATFILITFVSAIICLIIGIKNNLHIRRMRSWRKHMLTMPSVSSLRENARTPERENPASLAGAGSKRYVLDGRCGDWREQHCWRFRICESQSRNAC